MTDTRARKEYVKAMRVLDWSKMNDGDPFYLLGVSYNATLSDIEHAFKEKSLAWRIGIFASGAEKAKRKVTIGARDLMMKVLSA